MCLQLRQIDGSHSRWLDYSIVHQKICSSIGPAPMLQILVGEETARMAHLEIILYELKVVGTRRAGILENASLLSSVQ